MPNNTHFSGAVVCLALLVICVNIVVYHYIATTQRKKISIANTLGDDDDECSPCRKTANFLNNSRQNYSKLIDFRRVILIVSPSSPNTFNEIDRLYRNLFAKIVYCLPAESSEVHLTNQSDRFFVKFGNKTKNAMFYSCISKVIEEILPSIEADNNFQGILHINGDLIVNLWNFDNKLFSLNSNNWLLLLEDKEQCINCSQKLDKFQPKQLSDALQEAGKIYPSFAKNQPGERKIWKGDPDFFYISKNYLKPALDLIRLFGKHGIYEPEILVGNIIRGLDRLHLKIIPNAKNQTLDEPINKLMIFKMATVVKNESERRCLYCHLIDKFDEIRGLKN